MKYRVGDFPPEEESDNVVYLSNDDDRTHGSWGMSRCWIDLAALQHLAKGGIISMGDGEYEHHFRLTPEAMASLEGGGK